MNHTLDATPVAALSLGAIQGTVIIPADILRGAEVLAGICYAQAESEEFSGDAVRSENVPPAWTDRMKEWCRQIGQRDLFRLGLRISAKRPPSLFATAGVDRHTDEIDNLCLILVVHNDGLTFVQGKNRHITQAGQWFVFDDRLPHEVKNTKKSTMYVCLSVPLESLGGQRSFNLY